jgi:hypothetical protein
MGDAGDIVGNSSHKDISTPIPSLAEEEAILKKKYGGLMPKKPPLISKDHERAFFDSADWALGKGKEPPGHKPRSMIEALRPKLQPTPHQSLPSRRSSLLPADGEVEGMSKFGCRTVLPSLSNSWGSVSWDFLVSVSVAFDQHNSLCVS